MAVLYQTAMIVKLAEQLAVADKAVSCCQPKMFCFFAPVDVELCHPHRLSQS